MKHLRKDYDAIQPWPLKRPHIVKHTNGSVEDLEGGDLLFNGAGPIIPDDEPVFLIRANDPVGAEVVRFWAYLAFRAGADMELVGRVSDWAEEMAEYGNANREPWKKAPDTPEGALR